MVEIVNMRSEKPKTVGNHFYVDRRSPVGNPFHMADESMRDRVCDLYNEYFYNMIECQSQEFVGYLELMKKALASYGSVKLFCWCAPKRCHAEVIKDWLEHG